MKRLYTRVYLHLLGAVLVVGVVTSLVFAHGWRVAMVHAWAYRFNSFIADSLGQHCGNPVERHRALEHFADGLDLDLTLRDPAGRLLDHRGPEQPYVTAGELSSTPELMLLRDHPVFVTVVHDPSGRVCGLAESSGRRPVHPPPLWRPIATVVLALLLIAVAAVPLARRISRPVEALTEGSRRLAQGDLAYRVPERVRPPAARPADDRPDQLDELTHAWNEMAERVEHLVHGQRELLANVSHEFRSPLTRIRMALALLPETPATGRHVADIESDLSELDDLIETLLTASRLEQSGLPTHVATLLVSRLFEELEERARRSPLLQNETLIVDRPSDTKPLFGDARLLARLLNNLVENAAKYGRSPIHVSAEHEKAHWRITISDEGPGIPRAMRERVFEPFARLAPSDATSVAEPQKRGFGLGLTLARRIVEVHGGTIVISATHPHADPERESGCTITVELPDELPST